MKYYSTLLLLICFTGNVYAQPAITPQPQQITLHKGTFNLRACKEVQNLHERFSKEAARLVTLLKERGYSTHVSKPKNMKPYIAINYVDTLPKEGYIIQVEKDLAILSAATEQGLFNAIRTFLQLIPANGAIPQCTIKDRPAGVQGGRSQ